MESKQRPVRLGIDLDGVIVAFVEGHLRRISEMFNITFPTPSVSWPTVWNYHLADGGINEQQDKAVWHNIKESPSFWYELAPYPDATKALTLLQMWTEQGRIEPYFITARPSLTAHRQTVLWLKQYGIEEPQVLVVNSAQQKVELVRALGIDAFVDDRPENVIAMRDQLPEVMSFIFDRPWNRQMEDGRALRVTSLMEFFANVELA